MGHWTDGSFRFEGDGIYRGVLSRGGPVWLTAEKPHVAAVCGDWTVGAKAEAERRLRSLFHESRGDTEGAGTIVVAGSGRHVVRVRLHFEGGQKRPGRLFATLPLTREGG